MTEFGNKEFLPRRTEPLPQSIENLELDNLPAKLEDQTLEAVQAIASYYPPILPADQQHIKKCLRVMLAVLPKRSLDEISGELFVAAYVKKLGALSNEHVGYIADKAMGDCKWFPTISECLEMGKDFKRNDRAFERYKKANGLIDRHHTAIRQEEWKKTVDDRHEFIRLALEAGRDVNYEWDEVRGLPKEIQQLGIDKGVFVDDPDFGMITERDAERMTKRRPMRDWTSEPDECAHEWENIWGEDQRCTKCMKTMLF